MFLSRGRKGSSVGVAITLVTFMVFLSVTIIDYAILFSQVDELQRFTKSAALYSLSMGRNFMKYEATGGASLMDMDMTPEYAKGYIQTLGPKTCSNGRCTIYLDDTTVYIIDGYTCGSQDVNISPEMNAPYVVNNNIYSFQSCVPAVGVRMHVAINIPNYFLNTRNLYMWGEANVEKLDGIPPAGFLPWEN